MKRLTPEQFMCLTASEDAVIPRALGPTLRELEALGLIRNRGERRVGGLVFSDWETTDRGELAVRIELRIRALESA